MKNNTKNLVKKNWFFLVLLLGIIFTFVKRYTYLPTYIVSNPDSQITFSTEECILEQTWQPTVKEITGIQVPYYAENNFSCDVQLKVFSDDYSEILVAASRVNYTFSAGETGSIDFSFKKIPVIQGERYRIQISLLNSTSEGTLQIAAGNNYGGCSILGKNVNQAVALSITFVKYSKLFWLVAVFFPLLSYSLFLMVAVGRKWEETICFSILFEGIILYCFGWFEHLLWGMSAVYLLAILSMLFAVYFYNKKDMVLKDLISPGLWIYFILFLVIVVTSNGDWLGHRDELRHWGIAVRDMFYYDSFAKHVNTTVILPRYLPFTALIEYAFVYMNGLFSEDLLFIAYQTMLLSVLIILCRPLQSKSGRKLFVPLMTVMIGVPIIFFNNISNSIMVDSLLAAIVAYILICYYSEEMTWFNRSRIIVALIALTLIKDMGLIFAGMISLIMFGDTLVMQIKDKRLRFKELLWPVLCVVMVLAVYFSWQFYLSIPVKTIDTVNEADYEAADLSEVSEMAAVQENTRKDTEVVSTAMSASGISLNGLIKVLSGEGEEYQYQTTRNFLIELFEGDTYAFSLFTVSFFDLLALVAFFVVSLGYFGYWYTDKIRMYTFAFLIFVASACLCAFLQVTYWFSFSMYEAIELTSFDRYLAPCICAIMITVLYLTYDKFQQQGQNLKNIKYLIAAITVFLTISVPIEGIVIEGKDIEGNTTDEITYGHSDIAEILRSVAKRGERVYFICSNSDGYSEYVFRNAVCPIVSEHANWNIVSTQEAYEEQYVLYGKENIDDNAARVLSFEAWKEELKGCQYVVVFHADELFRESYGDLFEKPTEIEDGSVYQVVSENGNILLELIGRTGIKGWH